MVKQYKKTKCLQIENDKIIVVDPNILIILLILP